jgi:hypothetical protein
MSFEELLKKAEKDKYYARMQQVLYRIIQASPDVSYLVNFIEPFLPHLNSPGLNALYHSIKNVHISYLALPGLIHNLVEESKHDEKLYKLLDIMARTYHL